MKNIFVLLLLVILSITGYSKTYYNFIALRSGDWDNSGTWTTVVRLDNVHKDKFIIPTGIIVTADENVNSMGFNDVEIQISGTLKIGPSSSLQFGNNSKIELLQTGSIEANGASQQIYIGNVLKYSGNKNKLLTGPLYADYSTGSAPEGFTAYTLLAVNFVNFFAAVTDHTVSVKWSASNEINSKQYEIEQQVNGNEWTKLGEVAATNSVSTVKSYSFDCNNVPSGLISYRLKLVDASGKPHYSNTISIRQQESQPMVNIFSSAKTVNVEFAEEVKDVVDVKVMNMNGHIVSSQSFRHPASKLSIDLSSIKSGDYVVYVSDQHHHESIKKIFLK